MIAWYFQIVNSPLLVVVWLIEVLDRKFKLKIARSSRVPGFIMVMPFVWAFFLFPLILVASLVWYLV